MAGGSPASAAGAQGPAIQAGNMTVWSANPGMVEKLRAALRQWQHKRFFFRRYAARRGAKSVMRPAWAL